MYFHQLSINRSIQETYKHKKGDAGEFVKEQMLESIAREMYVKERYEKEKAARPGRKMMGRLPNGKMVELIPGRNGKLVPIGELSHDIF